MELELRPVEGALARQHLDLGDAGGLGGALQLLLGDVPDLVGPEPQLGPQGQLHRMQLQAAVAVDRLQQPDELRRLRLDLVLAAEDVGVVLGEGADAEDAV